VNKMDCSQKENIGYKELLEKYQTLLTENDRLKEEIKNLRIQPCVEEPQEVIDDTPSYIVQQELILEPKKEGFSDSPCPINKMSDSKEKIKLFMSLFKGREDVYAKRWENNKKGTSGYSPACANEWQTGLCQKPGIPCSGCKSKDYLNVNEEVIEDHLRGRYNVAIGIYPMLLNETCYFLAIDFDDKGWQKDVSILRQVCSLFKIPIAIERSRSGNGAHIWFFFEQSISASLARRFGSAMLTSAMSRKHDISFKSYDRLFPNQDTMPKGGFGNLIALPLQKSARANSNSVFLDDHFQTYEDQWAFLASIRKLSEEEVEILISRLCQGNELGILKKDEETEQKPWETTKIELKKEDFPKKLEIVKANMLFIPKTGFSQRALNHIKRLAAFKNPEFYKAQALRMPTFNKPRIISCADETTDYLCLPRGCEGDIDALSAKFNQEVYWIDKTNAGRAIDVEFKGTLRDQQPLALAKLLEYNNGILCGTAAFGKTVAAIKLIGERKTNTLILVNRISLLSQWKDKLTEFLKINETLSTNEISHGHKRKNGKSIIGMLGGGKQSLNGIVDIALMQSLSREGVVNEYVKDYGMVIVDECHHVSAFSFEMILKSVNAKYVYGLTATPSRKDGHHPIILFNVVQYGSGMMKKNKLRNDPFTIILFPGSLRLRYQLMQRRKKKICP
jgi:hypothetical protein